MLYHRSFHTIVDNTDSYNICYCIQESPSVYSTSTLQHSFCWPFMLWSGYMYMYVWPSLAGQTIFVGGSYFNRLARETMCGLAPIHACNSFSNIASFPGSTDQLFLARSKITAYFTMCEKSWSVEPGNEASSNTHMHTRHTPENRNYM